MPGGYYTIEAITFNGQYYDTPQLLTFPCSEYLEPIGIIDVVDPTFNGPILKRKVYSLRHKLDMMGTAQFSTREEYDNFINQNCYCCDDTPPEPPGSTCPTNTQAVVGCSGFCKQITFSWNDVTGADGYRIVIYENPDATGRIETIFTTTSPYVYNGEDTLELEHTYYVRILSYTGTIQNPVFIDTNCDLITFRVAAG